MSGDIVIASEDYVECPTCEVTIEHNTSVESDILEYAWDFGMSMPHRLIGYWVGLQMVSEQLGKNNLEKN